MLASDDSDVSALQDRDKQQDKIILIIIVVVSRDLGIFLAPLSMADGALICLLLVLSFLLNTL